MKETSAPPCYKRHRFPPEIIAHAVWRYYRFALSYRDMAELLAERGVTLTDESVRRWRRKFGQADANELRRRRPQPGDTWHLDEVFVQINGQHHSLWRAVDQDGQVRDILIQARRDQRAAVRFLRKLLKGLAYVPRVVVTATLASDGAVLRDVLPSVEHRRHTGRNNRAENAHPPLAFAGRLVGMLGAVVASCVPPMRHVRQDFAQCRPIAGQRGGDDHPRHVGEAFEQLP